MWTFLTSFTVVLLRYLLYGTLVERVFGIDKNAQTPAITKQDGVD